MQLNKCNCFRNTQTHLGCRTAHTLICFSHKQCVSKKKQSESFPSCAHTNMHMHLRGRCCIRALQNAHTESVPHLHWFKLPSGPIWRIWPPEMHTNTPHLWNTQPTCSCMHAKTNMHAHTNRLAKQHSSVTDIKSVGSIGLAYVEVCHISFNIHVNTHKLESCPDHSEDKQNISSVFQYVPKCGSRPAGTRIHIQTVNRAKRESWKGEVIDYRCDSW